MEVLLKRAARKRLVGSESAVVRDLLLVIWWAFILWLLITGKKESRPTDSK
jgi:hypothetical protein